MFIYFKGEFHDPTDHNRCINGTNETEVPYCYCKNTCDNKCHRFDDGPDHGQITPTIIVEDKNDFKNYQCERSEYFKQMDFKKFEMGNLLYINHIVM